MLLGLVALCPRVPCPVYAAEHSELAFARSVCRLVMAASIKVRAPRRSVLAASGLLGSGPVLTTTSRARSGVYSQP
jgi:hypothetical protein